VNEKTLSHWGGGGTVAPNKQTNKQQKIDIHKTFYKLNSPSGHANHLNFKFSLLLVGKK
jgi:hypothetical protein